MWYPKNRKKKLFCGSDGSIGTPVSPECVSGWQERLWESLVAFEAVQMEHSKAFAGGRCDNLMARRAEREQVLARVQMALEAVQCELLVGEDGGFAKRVRAKFAALIENETTLAEGARKVRKQLVDELGAIRQGKRVLQGYRQHHGTSPRPRFVNRKV